MLPLSFGGDVLDLGENDAQCIGAPRKILRAGTEVPLRMEESLDSNDKALREGQQIRMSVASDVRLGNLVVIPAGSPNRAAHDPVDHTCFSPKAAAT